MLLVENGEYILHAGVEILLDHESHAAQRKRLSVFAQRAQRMRRRLTLRRPLELDHREQLRDLRASTPHPPQLGAELLRQRDRARLATPRRSLTVGSFTMRSATARHRASPT
jgi:hypothetical protein